MGEALGLELKSTLDILKEWYPNEKGKTLNEFLTHSRVYGGHGGVSTTNSLKYRYVSEDVPVALVFASSLGKFSNIPTPTIDFFILLASILNKENYRAKERSLDRLGFSGMNKEKIINYVNMGK